MPDPNPPSTFLDLVCACDDFPYDHEAVAQYYTLYLQGSPDPHGYLTPAVVQQMPWTDSFQISHNLPRTVTVHGRNASSINTAFQTLINTCIDNSLFSLLCGQHSELCQLVSATKSFPEGIYIERFATSLFGLTMRGAHLIAYTYPPGTGEMHLWIPRRAAHLFIAGGKLDTTVAGGIKGSASPLQTIIEEADEEASLPADLIKPLIKPHGVISHMGLTGPDFPGEQGLVTPDYVYVYDMQLPPEVVPKPHDEEVSGFQLMPLGEVMERLKGREFKPDSAAVVVEFLVRHGVLNAENEGGLVEISMRLHRRLPFEMSR